MIRVLVADDHALARMGLTAMLGAQPDLEVVAEAADGLAAVEEARRVRPHIVLMDIRMPRLDGIEATRRIRALPDAPAVLVLTTFDLDQYVYDALRAGAGGFLLKDAPPGRLAEAVRTVAEGHAILAPTVTRRLIERFLTIAPRDTEVLARLTDREREVLTLIGQGRSNAEIATDLLLAEGTVKTHVSRVLMKTGLRDRVAAVVFAYEQGLVRVGNAGTA
ncbi:response regulator transcription factor [Herbidospora sp. NBRC 101105]|uniref:response regulator n=1 Tax=Herbidospora sp. NBRC 101105 TaxID=3032195 RepID=UPI0024A2E402|nr:response regulator transcription factor [Herbidospora sp. NBRC 101105]GLX99179.1 DNA-binding response regulator [Herbidospora sp. NBRC 101105]